MPNQHTPLRSAITPIGPSISYIPLTQGRYTLVDSDDATWLTQWNWCAQYRPRCGDWIAVRRESNSGGRTIFMHAAILGVRGRAITADHIIPKNGLDNRRCNLRAANHSEQACNRYPSRNNSSGYKGVTFHTQNRTWRARVCLNGKVVYQSSHPTKERAAQAYKEAATQWHGEFARI